MSAQTDFCMEIGIFHENVRNTFVNKCKMIDNQYAVLCQSQIPVLKVLGLNPSGITGCMSGNPWFSKGFRFVLPFRESAGLLLFTADSVVKHAEPFVIRS